jgi:hypothetical protein
MTLLMARDLKRTLQGAHDYIQHGIPVKKPQMNQPGTSFRTEQN